jgi:hypothetical protein
MSPTIQTVIRQEDFSNGTVRDVAPHLIDPSGAYAIVNGLLDPDGAAPRRGGTENKSNAGFGSTGLRWITDVYLTPGQRTVFANKDDFGVLAADDATPVNLGGSGVILPAPSAVLKGLLFIGGGWIYGGSRKTAGYSTGTVALTQGSKIVTGTGTSWAANADAGMLFQRANERVYSVASVDSNTQLTLADPYEPVGGTGISYSLTNLYQIHTGDPYQSSAFYTVCMNRLCVGTGNIMRFSGINNPHSYGANDYHEIPGGAQILGLGTSGQILLIFTTAGVWRVTGLALNIVDENGNAQHRLDVLSQQLILFSTSGAAANDQMLVVPFTDGVHMLDGISTPVKISKPIDKLLMGYVERGYRCGTGAVFRGCYFLPILDSSGAVRDLLVCRLDRPTRSRSQTVYPWMQFAGDGGEITAFTVRQQSSQAPTPLLLGAQARTPSRVVKCNAYFDPDGPHKADADGSAHQLDIITRDYDTGGGTENVVRRIRARYELVDAASDDPTILFDWGDGALDLGGAKYDTAIYDTDIYASEMGSAWNALACTAGESDGRDVHKCWVNKRRRYVRFRIRTNGPCAYAALRNFEVFIRPSQAVRR